MAFEQPKEKEPIVNKVFLTEDSQEYLSKTKEALAAKEAAILQRIAFEKRDEIEYEVKKKRKEIVELEKKLQIAIDEVGAATEHVHETADAYGTVVAAEKKRLVPGT